MIIEQLCEKKPDYDGILRQYALKKQQVTSINLSRPEEASFSQLMAALRQLQLVGRSDELPPSRDELAALVALRIEDNARLGAFVDELGRFEASLRDLQTLEKGFKEIQNFPTRNSIDSYIVASWGILGKMSDTASELRRILEGRNSTFAEVVDQSISSKSDLLVTRLSSLLFLSQDFFLVKEPATHDAFSFDLDLLVKLKSSSGFYKNVGRFDEIAGKFVQRKLVQLIDTFGHIVSLEFNQRSGRITAKAKPIMNFDISMINFLKQLDAFLDRADLPFRFQSAQVSLNVIDHYLHKLIDLELIDKESYILANKPHFEALISHRNSLVEAAKNQAPSNKRETSFEEAFRQCGFMLPGILETDPKMNLWYQYGMRS